MKCKYCGRFMKKIGTDIWFRRPIYRCRKPKVYADIVAGGGDKGDGGIVNVLLANLVKEQLDKNAK